LCSRLAGTRQTKVFLITVTNGTPARNASLAVVPELYRMVPVDVIDLSKESCPTAGLLRKTEALENDVAPANCEIEIEINKR
jgi:hypothetical protein